MPGELERVQHGAYREIHSDETLSPNRRLLKHIVLALSSEAELSASDITVEVRGRKVLLTGNVDTINSKYRAEETVGRLHGVDHIENQLAVRLGEALDEFTRGADASRLREDLARSTKKD
jgi:osmotically-inducible protein OsmY